MKLFCLTLLFIVTAVQAESTLSCWNVYGPKVSPHVMSATIESDNILTNIVFNFSDDSLSPYFISTSTQTSSLSNPTLEQRPSEISTSRSPYKGHNEYVFVIGKSSYRTANFSKDVEYSARIILPKDLSNENLKKTILKAGERSNGIVQLDPVYGSGQSGQSYLRMFCTSK